MIGAERVMRPLRFLCLLGLLTSTVPARAATSSFDLAGPNFKIAVTHGGATLPLARVPNLTEGDQIAIKLDPQPGQSEHYRIVAAFLRGASDRPDSKWFHEALSWKPKQADLSLTVPKDAQQMALFIVPERGGSADAIASTVRKQPGAFVRAVQELNQASLDRARLDTFLHVMLDAERTAPQSVATVSPTVARSLSIRLKEECLQQPAELQAACLTVDRETLLLADTHSSALADTLAGAPSDLAFQLSATPQAGYGSYSSYIGVVRDLFRLVGAFQSTQLQFIPALSKMDGEQVSILLNTPISFGKPASVMVVALPAIEAPKPPPLRRSAPEGARCAAPGLTLPVEGAPLIYATGYAHDMVMRFKRPDGTQVEVPLRADAGSGGFVLDGPFPTGPLGPDTTAQLHGNWGFAPFDGPSFALSRPEDNGWKAADRTTLVVGRTNQLGLTGGGAGCVSRVEMRRGDGAAQPVTWKQTSPDAIEASIPLEKADPGALSILVYGRGGEPAVMKLRAFQEAGSLDDLTFHAGESEAELTGSRLDQVASATFGGVAFQPGALTRIGKRDHLTLRAADPVAVAALASGKNETADVVFASGRHKAVSLTVAPPRPAVALVHVSGQAQAHEGVRPITIVTPNVFAQDARLAFAFHVGDTAALTGKETIEVATADGRALTVVQPGKGYDLQDANTGIVSLVPADALGPTTYGPLRFRVVSDGAASAWTPLATVVRLPEVRAVTCASSKACKLAGSRLFLIAKVGTTASFAQSEDVPDGFVCTDIASPLGSEGRIFLKLRDAPEAIGSLVAR